MTTTKIVIKRANSGQLVIINMYSVNGTFSSWLWHYEGGSRASYVNAETLNDAIKKVLEAQYYESSLFCILESTIKIQMSDFDQDVYGFAKESNNVQSS